VVEVLREFVWGVEDASLLTQYSQLMYVVHGQPVQGDEERQFAIASGSVSRQTSEQFQVSFDTHNYPSQV
jgi:hypothetical protein